MNIDLLGIIIIVCGILDGIKYYWESSKIKMTKSSRDVSRKFLVCGIATHICIIICYCLKRSLYIPMLIVWIIGLIFLLQTYWICYLYYPYKKKRNKSFKRPSILYFTWNALIPNCWRRHL